MATHSSVLAWRIPGTGESGGLPSMGSHRVRHDCSDLAAAVAARSSTGASLEALGFLGGTSDKESTCQCRRCKRRKFDLWVRKVPWSREWQPAQVFSPGKGVAKSWIRMITNA